MEEFRILLELDENGQPTESVAIYSATDNIIVDWESNFEEALEWVKFHGKLAILNY